MSLKEQARAQVTSLVERLVEARHDAGLSIQDVAVKMGVAPNTVRRFEAPHSDPTLTMLMLYVGATGGKITADVVELDNG